MKYLIIFLTLLILNSCGSKDETSNTINRVKVNRTSNNVDVVRTNIQPNNVENWIDENIIKSDLETTNEAETNFTAKNSNDNNWRFEFSDIKTFFVETFTSENKVVNKYNDVKKTSETQTKDDKIVEEMPKDIEIEDEKIIEDDLNKDVLDKQVVKEKIYIDWDFGDSTNSDEDINTDINSNTNTIIDTDTSTNTWTLTTGEIIDTSIWGNSNAKEAWEPVIKN